MLTTKLSAPSISPSSSTLFLNSHKTFRFNKRIPSFSNPSLFNPLRLSLEWTSAAKKNSNSARKMDSSATSRIVSPRAAAEKLKDPDQLIDSVETFIFDCDGQWRTDVSFCVCLLVNAIDVYVLLLSAFYLFDEMS